MILQSFVDTILGLISLLLSLIPTVESPTSFYSSALTTIEPWTRSIGYFIPLATLQIVLGVILSIEGAKFAMSILNFTTRKIPTIS